MAASTWKMSRFAHIVAFFCLFQTVFSLPDQGIWDAKLDQNNQYFTVSKSLYNNSQVMVKIECHSPKEVKIKIGWLLRRTDCAEEYIGAEDRGRTLLYYTDPRTDQLRYGYKQVELQRSTGTGLMDTDDHTHHDTEYICNGDTALLLQDEETRAHLTQTTRVYEKKAKPESVGVPAAGATPSQTAAQPQQTTEQKQTTPRNQRGLKTPKRKRSARHRAKRAAVLHRSKRAAVVEATVVAKEVKKPNTIKKASTAVAKVWRDGIYLFILKIDPMGVQPGDFSADVTVYMKGTHGYLSAIEWPLLPFYGVMCVVYVIFGFAWLFMSACNWRDLLRIQFWIGGVIVLGMLEKAVFYAEYQTINSTGRSVRGAVLFAEIVSCLKRTLARMLVVIVSLGFGIVKPRLGAMLHRILGMGILYFILGSIEGCLRVTRPKGDLSSQPLLASIPLAVLDAAICWWVFTSLVNTTRTLRLRRNIVKLSLYRHFTNTLIFAVLASIAFMIWSIKQHKLANCLTDWREIWVDDAYWHILFSVILLAIIVLWRPTINNQRYAFSPLLDSAEEDDEDDSMVNDAFDGIKMRGQPTSGKRPHKDAKAKTEDDLKWIEENIPSSGLADAALPSMLDSDEEIMTTKFEMSKME